MKLAEKGRFAPPPSLEPVAQRVSESVASWDGVHARAHWLLGDESEVDGADFYFGQHEIGHIHLDSEAHIFQPRLVANALIRARLARRFEWSASAVKFAIDRSLQVERALWLFRLSYDHHRGATPAELIARINSYAAPSHPRARVG